MKYLEIELKGYKRLALNSIHYIKITLTEMIQLILGTNGSGKSSLIKELSPLPAVSNEYAKDGYKIITIEHNGHHYILKSEFSPSQKHTFLKDGVNLNEGGTGQVQKELVRQEFGYTNDVQNVMVGNDRFHMMSPLERRRWFMMLSDTDYQYAISVFQKFKDRYRECVAVISHLNKRLVQENGKLLSGEQEEGVRRELESYKELLTQLIHAKPSISKTGYEIQSEIGQTRAEIIQLTHKLQNAIKGHQNYERYSDMDAILSDIMALNGDLQVLRHQSETLSAELEAHHKTQELLKKSNLESTSGIDEKIQGIQEKIHALLSRQSLRLTCENPSAALAALDTISASLTEVFNNIIPDPNKEFSKQNYILLTEALQNLGRTIIHTEELQRKIIDEIKSLEHRKEHNLTECPQCKHTWVREYDPLRHRELTEKLNKLVIEIENQQKQKATLSDKISTFELYSQYSRNYRAIVQGWPILNPLWDYIGEKDLYFTDPGSLTQLVNTARMDYEILFTVKQAESELEELLKIKQITQAEGQAGFEKLTDRIAVEEYQLSEVLMKIRILNDQIASLNRKVELLKLVERLKTELQLKVDKQSGQYETLVTAHRQEILNDLILKARIELSAREKQLSEVESQKALVKSIQDQIDDLTKSRDISKMLMETLSPTDGLIAEGMMGFINHFIKQMNQFIKKVWLYPLEIIPCQLDGDDGVDLDYKFPLSANNHAPVPDVKNGSTAMREIVDLAFKVVASRMLMRSDVPLMLDEFASSFDTLHREAAFKAIDSLILQNTFSQVFVISHYQECYGSLSNAEITLLCGNNVILPKDAVANNHVVMK
jgi:Fe-S cluster assembly ATPase SufC/predicted  nucleic acid-binding Zn-ribbon protein